MIAISITDLSRHDRTITALMVGPHTRDARSHPMGPHGTDSAVVIECEDGQALAIIDALRTIDRQSGRYPTRAYRAGPRGGWAPIH